MRATILLLAMLTGCESSTALAPFTNAAPAGNPDLGPEAPPDRAGRGPAVSAMQADLLAPPPVDLAPPPGRDEYAVADLGPVPALPTGAEVATATSIHTDRSAYLAADEVVVTYSGGSPVNWIAIARAGSSLTSYQEVVAAGGLPGGTTTFGSLAPGLYVARALFDGFAVMQGESEPFEVVGP